MRTQALMFVVFSGCFSLFTPTGPYACNEGQCPAGHVCDEGLCCVPGASPACPTLPSPSGQCADGSQAFTIYQDADRDGVGTSGRDFTRVACAMPQGHWARVGGDCDDTLAHVLPGAEDDCDGFDNNCNGEYDEGAPMRRRFYRDADGDSFGDATDPGTLSCLAPPGSPATNADDCNDNTPTRSPNATEVCNGIDDDCDGQVDDGPLLDALTPTDPAMAFACLVPSARGVCQAGKTVCINGVRVCRALTTPSLDVCNRLDDDCDGQVDEQPDCGGPANLFDATHSRVRAFQYPATAVSSFSSLCPSTLAGGVSVPVDVASRTWRFNYTMGQPAYVLSFEPADGGAWDVTGAGIQLAVALNSTFSSTVSSAGGAWGDATFFRTPVITLCGERDDELVRFVSLPDAGLRLSQGALNTTLPMTAGGDWIFGISSGFDVSKVKRVAMVFRPFATGTASYELRFSTIGFTRTGGAP